MVFDGDLRVIWWVNNGVWWWRWFGIMTRPGKRLQFANLKVAMDSSLIYPGIMLMFHSFLYVYQRVTMLTYPLTMFSSECWDIPLQIFLEIYVMCVHIPRISASCYQESPDRQPRSRTPPQTSGRCGPSSWYALATKFRGFALTSKNAAVTAITWLIMVNNSD